jgi:3-oxoacyl-[acyl-carrier-protein] synthase III
MLHARITGTGSLVPTQVPANYCAGKRVDTNNAWITTCTGTKERCRNAGCEYASALAITTAGFASLEMTSPIPVVPDLIIPTTTGTFTSDDLLSFLNHCTKSTASIPFVLDEVSRYCHMSNGDLVLSATLNSGFN